MASKASIPKGTRDFHLLKFQNAITSFRLCAPILKNLGTNPLKHPVLKIQIL